MNAEKKKKLKLPVLASSATDPRYESFAAGRQELLNHDIQAVQSLIMASGQTYLGSDLRADTHYYRTITLCFEEPCSMDIMRKNDGSIECIRDPENLYNWKMRLF